MMEYKKGEKVMKRNRIKGKSGKSSKKLVTVVIAAMIVMVAMTAFTPLAAAGITSFTITPDTGMAGEVAAYMVMVNTTGYKSMIINVTIPAGFGAVAPTTGGEQIAKVDLYKKSGWFAGATFTSNDTNPSTEVDVEVVFDGVTLIKTIEANYSAGGTTSVSVAYLGMSLDGDVTLPTATRDGYLNASVTQLDGINLTNVSIDIKQFVQNPAEPGDYTFEAKVDGDTADATVHIRAPAPVPALTPIGLLALVGILSIVLAFATSKRKVQK